MLAFLLVSLAAFVAADEPACETGFTMNFKSTLGQHGGLRFGNAFDTDSTVFSYSTPVSSTTLQAFRCSCLSQCHMKSACVAVMVQSFPLNYKCRGLTYHTAAKPAEQTSESWTLDARQPSLPPGAPVVPTTSCGGATLAFKSSTTSGFRFNNIYQPNARSFQFASRKAESNIDDFRCECLTRCSSTNGCKAASIVSQFGKLYCYGMFYPGEAMAFSSYSESWLLP